MSRLSRLRLNVTLDAHAWKRPDSCVISTDDEGERWVDWTGSEPVWIEGTGGLLDAFVWIGRRPRARGTWSAEQAALKFVESFGPWGYCESGRHYHPPFRSRPFSGPYETGTRIGPTWAGRGAPSAVETPTKDLLSSLVHTARQVDALRRINAHVWELYWPEWTRHQFVEDWRLLDYPAPVDGRHEPDRRAEATFASDIVNAWIRTMHVFPAAGRPEGSESPGLELEIAVGGVAAGLALAMLRELTQEPAIAICPDCLVTHLQQSNRTSRKCDACRQRGNSERAEAPGSGKRP